MLAARVEPKNGPQEARFCPVPDLSSRAYLCAHDPGSPAHFPLLPQAHEILWIDEHGNGGAGCQFVKQPEPLLLQQVGDCQPLKVRSQVRAVISTLLVLQKASAVTEIFVLTSPIFPNAECD